MKRYAIQIESIFDEENLSKTQHPFVINFVVDQNVYSKILELADIVAAPTTNTPIDEILKFIEDNWRNYKTPNGRPDWIKMLKIVMIEYNLDLKTARDLVRSNTNLNDAVDKWDRECEQRMSRWEFNF